MSRIVTSGAVLRSSTVQAQDLVYYDAFGDVTAIRSLDQHDGSGLIALEELLNEIDGEKLREGIEAIHELGSVTHDLEILRAKVLESAGMDNPLVWDREDSLWDLAEDLGTLIEEHLDTLKEFRRILDRIAMTDPALEDPEPE